ncbi:MAG: hypothetical protein R3F51_23855 [Cyanobacteriota/Melainabacteria group bacterium]
MPNLNKNGKLIDQLFIAAPCNIAWDEMEGDNRARNCDGCSSLVYNTSSLYEEELERLLEVEGDRVCLYIERDPQGKLVTKERFGGLIRKLAATLLGLLLSMPTLLAKDATTDSTNAKKGTDKKNPRLSHIKESRPAKIKVNDRPLPPGRVCIPRPNKDSDSNTDSVSTPNPSWLTDKKARDIVHDWPAKPTKDNADKRAFMLYQLARHQEARGNTSFARQAYEDSLKLLKGEKYDPKFRKNVETQYQELLKKLSSQK